MAHSPFKICNQFGGREAQTEINCCRNKQRLDDDKGCSLDCVYGRHDILNTNGISDRRFLDDNNEFVCDCRKDIFECLWKNDIAQVHSLRHTSVTYKLKLSGGDIKAVQGDSGHAQADMVTEVYGHIIDEDRRKNAERMEKKIRLPYRRE